MSGKRSVEALRQVAEFMGKSKGFDRFARNLRIIDGGDGKCKAEIKLEPEHINLHGSVHGGVVATLLDVVTTYALMTKPSNPGVSVDLQVMLIKGPRVGEELVINANTVSMINNVAHIDCELCLKSTGEVIGKGSQSKYVES